MTELGLLIIAGLCLDWVIFTDERDMLVLEMDIVTGLGSR